MKKFILCLLLVVVGMLAFAEKNLAVATFDVVGGAVTREEAESITELYITELVATGKVSVVDRTNFEKILKEMKFQSSDWSDSDKTAELGKAVNAEIIARGQIIKLGSKMYLSATIIDVKSAKVLSSARKDFNSIDDIFGLLTDFTRDVVESLSPGVKIGDVGPGGGMVFYVEGNKAMECSEVLGSCRRSGASDKCKNYHGGGYSDWHLPSIDELYLVYKNLYLTGKIDGSGNYWSSTDMDSVRTYIVDFSYGKTFTLDEFYCSVRAVRVFHFYTDD